MQTRDVFIKNHLSKNAQTSGAVQRERERAAAVRRPGVFPKGKTLMRGRFTPPQQVKKSGVPRSTRQRALGMGPTMTGPMISKMFKEKPPFRSARAGGTVRRGREGTWRGYVCQTVLPPWMVSSTRMERMSMGSTAVGSAERTMRSACLPGLIEPRMSSREYW